MRAPRLLPPALLLSAVVLAGCGSASSYAPAKTRACLKDQGLKVAPPPADDYVAQSATVGAFRAAFPGLDDNAVTISFGDSSDDAKQIAEGYVRVHSQNVGVFDILAVERNAVLLWKQHPSDGDLATVTSCLK